MPSSPHAKTNSIRERQQQERITNRQNENERSNKIGAAQIRRTYTSDENNKNNKSERNCGCECHRS